MRENADQKAVITSYFFHLTLTPTCENREYF